MLSCPEDDWNSNSEDAANEQVGAFLLHYESTHGEGLPTDTRELLKACARALGGARV